MIAADWIARWDRQQTGYIPDREQVFALMLDVVERLGGKPARVLDLACGTGSLAGRARARWPEAEIVAVDLDPVLLELGRRTLGDGVTWAEADLRAPGWESVVGAEPVDAVLTATALHWLTPAELAAALTRVAGIVRPGGVFLDYDTMALDRGAPRLGQLAEQLSAESTAAGFADPGVESWEQWWDALRREPELAERFAERDRRFADRSHHAAPPRSDYEEPLRAAGFAEVAVLHQVADRTLLAAVR